MRLFKSKWFCKFSKKERISDATLCQIIKDAEAGKIDAHYGGGVIKQRIASPHKGKSGGYRSIILYRQEDKAFFVFGFSKADRQNITQEEEREFKRLAKITLSLSDADLEKLLVQGVYIEVPYDKKK